MMTPTRQVIIPVTKRAPPPMNTGKSLAQANMLPERIVNRQELAPAAVRTGPMTTIIIPRMKISDLNYSRPIGSYFPVRRWAPRKFSKSLLLSTHYQGYDWKKLSCTLLLSNLASSDGVIFPINVPQLANVVLGVAGMYSVAIHTWPVLSPTAAL